MKRVLVLALLLILAAGAAAWYLGWRPADIAAPDVSVVRYDSDADGTVDLVQYRVGGAAALWRWDRDGDGEPEVVAWDSTLSPEGEPRRTGRVTAWDLGGDGILDEGDVPEQTQSLLASEEVRAAMAEAEGDLQLVDMEIRGFIGEMQERYDDWRLSGFRMPIVGARLPDADRLLPGAPRRYRFGTHQGFDMYPGHVGTPTGYGGPVVAAKAGTVIRADVDYEEMTPEEYQEAIATSRAAGATPPDILDQLRGRQVWIDHGHGIVTRYAHLSSIAPEIREGVEVDAAQIIAFVGNSGMEAGTQGSESGAHLHFELRIDDSYFGEGLSPDAIRSAARGIFTDLPPPE
ncbi:MAG: M23 family metallopeptidase [Acidobacteriota bacterium]